MIFFQGRYSDIHWPLLTMLKIYGFRISKDRLRDLLEEQIEGIMGGSYEDIDDFLDSPGGLEKIQDELLPEGVLLFSSFKGRKSRVFLGVKIESKDRSRQEKNEKKQRKILSELGFNRTPKYISFE